MNPHADAEESFQIVLRRVAEERQPEAALFLSGCLSLPLASSRNIAASAPITLLADLRKGQAEAILAEFRPALPADMVIDIGPSGEAGVSRLQWPRPPRVYGKDVADFVPSPGVDGVHDIKCPVCGGMLRVVNEGGALRASPVSAISGRARSEAAVSAAAPADDNDPLFSGIKPLAASSADYASLRSLQAGDTGFWMDNKGLFSPGGQPAAASASPVPGGGTSHSRRARASAGLAAFMKPGVFAVVSGRSRDPQVVKMIAEIMGIPEGEARDKCLAPSLAVARDIALDEAQSLLARLRNLGAKARIVRPA
jgi:ribosomal protein L7/L12